LAAAAWELHDLLERGSVDPGDGRHALDADGRELDVVRGGIALARPLIRARAGPRRRIRGAVGGGEGVDRRLERAAHGRLTCAQASPAALPAAAVDLRVAVGD